jgi:hypothetical protein
MSVIINGMKLPQHAAVNGEKDTAYKCVILAHPDNSVELVIDTKFASAYDNGHNIQRYPITEIPTPHGRLIDADISVGSYVETWTCNCTEFGAQRVMAVDDLKYLPTIIEAEVE